MLLKCNRSGGHKRYRDFDVNRLFFKHASEDLVRTRISKQLVSSEDSYARLYITLSFSLSLSLSLSSPVVVEQRTRPQVHARLHGLVTFP